MADALWRDVQEGGYSWRVFGRNGASPHTPVRHIAWRNPIPKMGYDGRVPHAGRFHGLRKYFVVLVHGGIVPGCSDLVKHRIYVLHRIEQCYIFDPEQ